MAQWVRGQWALGSQCLWPLMLTTITSITQLTSPQLSSHLKAAELVPTPVSPHSSGFLWTRLEVYSLVSCFSAYRGLSSVPPMLFQKPHCVGWGGQRGEWPNSLDTKVCHLTGPHDSSAGRHKEHSSSLGVLDLGLAWTPSLSEPPIASTIKARIPASSTHLLPDTKVTCFPNHPKTDCSPNTMMLLVSES